MSEAMFLSLLLIVWLCCEAICLSGKWRTGSDHFGGLVKGGWQYRIAMTISGMCLGAAGVYIWKAVL